MNVTIFTKNVELEDGNKVHELIYSQKLDMDYIESELKREALSLARDMERTAKMITDGMNVNSLGEVQNRGSKIDVLCARRAASADTMVKLLHLAGLR